MLKLSKQSRRACQEGAPAITDQELEALKPQIPEWEIITENSTRKLRREYDFDDFRAALNFTVQVGKAAEEQGHHPTIITEWGSTTIIWWTHKIDDLHLTDLIMAAKCDELYQKATNSQES